LESDLRDLRRKRLLLAANNPSLEQLIDFVLMLDNLFSRQCSRCPSFGESLAFVASLRIVKYGRLLPRGLKESVGAPQIERPRPECPGELLATQPR